MTKKEEVMNQRSYRTARTVILLLLATLLLAAPASADRRMRHDGRRVEVGDSVADVISQFGEPTMKIDLGEIDDGWRRCKVQLWVYEWFPWRYELRIGRGIILRIDKIRLRKVR
jgi:hypothetical protein